MAVLVGLDEAGYGPHLGPLVVAAAAVRIPDDLPPDPNLWPRLSAHVRAVPEHRRPRTRPGTPSSNPTDEPPDTRVLICDSKQAYAARNPAPLERAVLGFLAAMERRPRALGDLLEQTGAAENEPFAPLHAVEASAPWHRPAALALPVWASQGEVASAAHHLRTGFADLGGRPEALRLNIAPAARFNNLIARTGNKASALFILASEILTDLARRWPGEAVHVTMDRHGGRRYYGDLLAQAFPLWQVTTLEEGPEVSRYRIRRGGPPAPAGPTAGGSDDAGSGRGAMLLAVHKKAETVSLLVALASMAAKYVRELYMRQLNRYFQALVPGLRPTAGYGRDAWRFLDEVAETCKARGLSKSALLRNR